MILKFLKQKTDDPLVARGYCDGGTELLNARRDEVKLIDGSPDDFVRVASSLRFQETFKSFVASWSRGDAPTEKQLEQFLEDFKDLSFAGMDRSRFCYCVYLHRKLDKVDVHVLVANVDLHTGKHFNIAPPNWMNAYYPLRDMHNARWGWARPEDPRLKRLIRPSYRVYGPENVRTLMPEAYAEATNTIQEAMLALVTQTVIKDRAGLVLELRKLGKVQIANNKDYVALELPHFKKPIRLRGLIFREDFKPSMLASLAPTPRPIRTRADREADKDAVEEAAAKARFDAAVKRRALENYERYLAPRKRASRKLALVADVGSTELPPINLAVLAIAEISKKTDPIYKEARDFAGQETTRRTDVTGQPWMGLMQSSRIGKERREQEIDRALSRFSEGFGERIRQRFDKLARTIEQLGRSVQTLAGRIVRRRQAERAHDALARRAGTSSRVKPQGRPGNR